MLYEELRALSRNEATYEEFLAIEKLYMADESMTKRQAAALWSKTYGPAGRYKNKIKAASRLRYPQMSRIWNELYSTKQYDCIDAETGLRFTLLGWGHPKLGKNVLTLAVLLKKGSPAVDSVMMTMPLTEIGDNKDSLWSHPSHAGIIFVNQ